MAQSPNKRREIDVMKLCAASRRPGCLVLLLPCRDSRQNQRQPDFFTFAHGWSLGRMMSDHDVTLVDDSSSDMYVIFHGPKDSACALSACIHSSPVALMN